MDALAQAIKHLNDLADVQLKLVTNRTNSVNASMAIDLALSAQAKLVEKLALLANKDAE
jgi:hypothetical protein